MASESSDASDTTDTTMATIDSTTPTKKKLVVVGLGMVGIAFIEKMLERDLLQKEYQITVLGEENSLAYNRVGLTEYFSTRSDDDLLLNDQEWYNSIDTNRMTYRIAERITAIDRENKTVSSKTVQNIPYDVLVLATGSGAVLPTALLPPNPTKSYSDMGVFVYRTITDVREIISFSEKLSVPEGTTKRAIVVGGGLLGLEAGKALFDLAVYDNVSIVHRRGHLLSQQLDEAGGRMLADKVRELGVSVLLSDEVEELIFDDDNQLQKVKMRTGDVLDCQLLCYAIGISPRDELARASGITCAKRGGVVVDNQLRSSDPSIYAIGECASWNDKVFGLIAPGVEMADVLSFNLTQAKLHQPRNFDEPDAGTRLKLMGVDVASFGDYFADINGPRKLPGKRLKTAPPPTPDDVVALAYHDPFTGVYKKLIFTREGDYLLGGILVGNIGEYPKLSSLVSGRKKLEKPPSEFIVGASSGEDDTADLDDSLQVCSCNNVTKGDLVAKIRDGSASSVGELKSLTKAAMTCGGCIGVVTAIFNSEMKALGQKVSNSLCIHFAEPRVELFHKIMVRRIDTFAGVMSQLSKFPDSDGCEICKPTIASILSSLYNKNVMNENLRGLQETNDRFLGNIQRNGTYSVVPRVSAGEITPEKLIALGEVARDYKLYSKITGGQRVDLFGAQKEDLPAIWEQLERVGFESGHAYGKSLRTVKSCVGTTWCRYGIGDSVGMALRLEERYKSIRAPHKFKGGVSGCVRDCAEFHNKDFGLCATPKGFSVYVGGNGGMKPAHALLLQADVMPDRVIPLLDRYIMFYIRTADRLQRTARWVEQLPGGIEYLREVVIHDKLGICDELERQMKELVESFFDEWKDAVNNSSIRRDFKTFANTTRRVETVEIVYERGQPRPADWPEEEEGAAKVVFKDHKWKSELGWHAVCTSDNLPDVAAGSSTTILLGDTQIALFRAKGKLFASQNMCGHRRAFVLSQGILSSDENGEAYVSCPLHKRNYLLEGANKGSCKNDPKQSIATFEIKDDGEQIWLKLPPTAELDELLATNKWKVRKSETKPRLSCVDSKFPRELPSREPAGCSEVDALAW